MYICGTCSFTIGNQKENISASIKQAYFAYFKEKISDQDKHWVSHKVCRHCVESLRMWTKGTRDKLTFVTPRIKRYPIVEMELLAWWYRGHIKLSDNKTKQKSFKNS